MTQEQKDWYDYGRKKAAWLIAKELDPGSEREIAQIAWDARKKAYRWLKRNRTCLNCKYDCNFDDVPCCYCCGHKFWEPKD